VNGAVEWKEPILVRDYRFGRENAPRPVKPVLTGPYTLARLSRNDHYASFEAMAMGLAEALNAEARALAAEEPPLIQFNEPAVTRHPEDRRLVESIWQRLLRGLSVETAVYFYFGEPGAAVSSAIEAGFHTVGIDATIEGAIAELAKGPKPAKLAAGVMDSRTTRLEDVDVLAGRIREARDFVGDDALYVNPNMGLEFLPREQAQAKLVRLAEAVNEVRGGAA
jgi:5-methyltetrahydropteroyltriglutamate--homocysteine methyltransferase